MMINQRNQLFYTAHAFGRIIVDGDGESEQLESNLNHAVGRCSGVEISSIKKLLHKIFVAELKCFRIRKNQV
jgi:hypothetical protein